MKANPLKFLHARPSRIKICCKIQCKIQESYSSTRVLGGTEILPDHYLGVAQSLEDQSKPPHQHKFLSAERELLRNAEKHSYPSGNIPRIPEGRSEECIYMHIYIYSYRYAYLYINIHIYLHRYYSYLYIAYLL